jgi:hypothetical protein
LFLFTASACALFVFGLHPFLAVQAPVQSEYLVIEGWIPGYAVEEGLKEFQVRGYGRVFTTGGSDSTSGGETRAESAAARLKQLGMRPESVEAVPSPTAFRNRTYSSAVGLRQWFEAHQCRVKSLNVMTVGAHARRTRLLYEEAFGQDVAIGIIAITNRIYDPRRWWRSSEGTKEVISEAVGYGYARLFFRPPAPARASDGH